MNVQPKSVLKGRKSDFDGIFDDDECPESPEDAYQPHSSELFGENTVSIILTIGSKFLFGTVVRLVPNKNVKQKPFVTSLLKCSDRLCLDRCEEVTPSSFYLSFPFPGS